MTARTDANGFFQISGVPPGRYWLEASRDSHGRAEIACDVEADAETFLSSIDLQPFGTLAIEVQPHLDPDGRPWTVAVRRVRDRQRQDMQAWGSGTTTGGRIEFGRITPGEYDVEVRTPAGDVWLADTWPVSGPADRLMLTVRATRVRGTVRRGTRPVPGALVSLEAGRGDVSILKTNPDGRFAGVVPELAGAAYLAVEHGDPPSRASFTFDPVPRDGDEVVLDIDLGSAEVHVAVVDEADVPVGNASVNLSRLDGTTAGRAASVSARTDAAGRVDLGPVPGGRYRLLAETRAGLQSVPAEIHLDDDSRSEVTLRIVDGRETELSMVSAAGHAVAGADVSLIIDDGSRRRVRTDLGGRATIRLPPHVQTLTAKVFAPGHVLWSGCVEATERAIVIRLPAGGGTIRLQPPDAVNADGQALFLVSSDGGLLTRSDLLSWRSRLGITAEPVDAATPAVAPGSYTAIGWSGLDEGRLSRLACARALGAGVDAGLLTAGGELMLKVTPPRQGGRRAG